MFVLTRAVDVFLRYARVLRAPNEQAKICSKRCPIIFQGHPSDFKVTLLKKIADFDPNWAFLGCNSSLSSPVATKWCTKLEIV